MGKITYRYADCFARMTAGTKRIERDCLFSKLDCFVEIGHISLSSPGHSYRDRTVILQAEFQANALRNVKIRKHFLEVQRRRAEAGAAIIREGAAVLGLTLSASPEDIVALLGSLSEGLAVRQALARRTDDTHTRRLALLCFDRLVTQR